jgi:hypothetical protein
VRGPKDERKLLLCTLLDLGHRQRLTLARHLSRLSQCDPQLATQLLGHSLQVRQLLEHLTSLHDDLVKPAGKVKATNGSNAGYALEDNGLSAVEVETMLNLYRPPSARGQSNRRRR